MITGRRPEPRARKGRREISGVLAAGWLFLSGCTAIAPRPPVTEISASPPAGFSHRKLDEVFKRYVDAQGFVDYSGLQANPDPLEEYYAAVSRYSPDSHPELFATDHDRLAYWINAYNAAVIKIVLHHYPISGVDAVAPPLPLFFLPRKAGFFFFQRPIFGGVSTSLYYLENSVIRDRFAEPRIHFALNCASRGCPRLPRQPFEGNNLDRQLDQETRQFFSEARNFRVDVPGNRLYLSSILDWYRDDFVDWVAARFPGSEPSLLKFVSIYLDDRQREKLNRLSPGFAIEFVPYDWRLNEQKKTGGHG